VRRLPPGLTRFPVFRPRSLARRDTVKDDAMAGLVLGVESVPDGLASGLLAGVNPVWGLYAYLYGMVGGALFTSTTFMTVQATGAMSIIVADVDLAGRPDPGRTLFTLSIATGLVMIVAGVLRLGSFLRFVSNSVMTGFITAVGVNIVLGQLRDFTGYAADGSNRLVRAVNTLLNFWKIDLPTLTVGVVTIVLIVLLLNTRVGALGFVVAVVAGSALAAVFEAVGWEVEIIGDIVDVPRALPFITAPVLRDIPALIVPAASLAFVGLVQGAGVSAGFPNEDGTPSDTSQDFIGQGAGNILSGLFQGIPVGGSMSASSLAVSAGARSRAALLIGGGVMAAIILLLADVVRYVAMPSLAGLLIVIGYSTIKPARVLSVARTGRVPLTVMSITLLLTMVIPLQYSVLVGVGISVILFVAGQSSRLVTKRLFIHDDGRVELVDPPENVPPGEVIVLQPFGSIFFASAHALRDQLPNVTPESRNAVVVLRIRGADDAGSTIMSVLGEYAGSLREVDSRLAVVTDSDRVERQLVLTGTVDLIGPERLYRSTVFLGETTRRAFDDARRWIELRRAGGEGVGDPHGSDREHEEEGDDGRTDRATPV
jgi:SulP family sulfate permease